MPRYEVTTDQGRFEVTLDREPTSSEELHSLVTEYLAKAGPQLQAPGDRWTPTSDILRDPANPGRQPVPPGLLTRMKDAFVGRLSQGATDVSEAFSPTRTLSDLVTETPPPTTGQRILRGIGGVANIISAPAAPAGVVGGDLMEGLVRQSGELTDEALDRKIAEQEMHPTVVDGPGSVAALKALRALPYEQRVKQAGEGGGAQAEFGVGFVPGYTLTGRGIAAGARALRRPAKVASEAAEVVEAVPTPATPSNVTRTAPMDAVDDVTEQVTGSTRLPEFPERIPPMDVPDEVAERTLGTTTTGRMVPRRSPKVDREKIVQEARESFGKPDPDDAPKSESLIEVEEARRATDAPIVARMDDAARTADPEDAEVAGIWSGALKPWLNRWFRSPEAVTKEHPDAYSVHLAAKDAEDFRDSLIVHWRTEFEQALHQAQQPRKTAPLVVRLLDTENPNLAGLEPDVVKAYTSARKVLDEIAESVKKPAGKRLSYYTQVGGKYTVEPLRDLIRGAARRVAFEGGIDPRSKQPNPGLKSAIGPYMYDEVLEGGKVKRVPRLPRHLDEYLTRDYLPVVTGEISPEGHIKGFGGEYPANRGMQRLMSGVNRYQFARTMGANPLSAGVNLTQQLLTLSHADADSFLRAYRDLFNPRMRQLAADAGIRGALSKGDVDRLARLSSGPIERVEDAMAALFQMSESLNRMHAYFTGLRLAKKRGLTDIQAQPFAKEFVDKTQFRMSRAGMPPAWHGGVGRRPFLQYKGFQYHYAKAMKDLALDDFKTWGGDVVNTARAAKAGDVMGAARSLTNLVKHIGTGKLAKFWGTGSLLFGPDVMTLGYVGNTPRAFGALQWKNNEDDPTVVALAKNGLLPYFGIWLGHQVGLGAMPIEDMKSFLFSLTGPSLAQLLDLASIGASVSTGMQYDFRPESYTAGEKPIDWHKNISKFVQMMPAGITLERARKAVMAGSAEDTELKRRAVTETGAPGLGRALRQSVGAEPITDTSPIERRYDPGALPVKPSTGEAMRQLIGLQGPATQRTFDRRQAARMEEQEIEQWATRAAEILAATRNMKTAMDSIPEDIRKRIGPSLPGRIRGAFRRAHLMPETRQMLQAPRHMRGRMRDILQEDEE